MPSHRILVVEDQREVSRLLRSALETLEHDLTVVECPSGEEAILDSSRNPIDLLVADYRLPGVSGIELMRKVRKDHPKSKVILITGQTDPKVRKEVANAGADAFFIKPVPMADFLDAVERHLGLVETLLPPEPIAPDDEEMVRSLPDLLAGLRQDLEAGSVVLLNDSGRVLARAGELPDGNNEVALISSLLSIHSAGRKISRLLAQQTPSSWHVFDSGKYDLIFAPVGAAYAMIVLGQGLAAEQRIMRTVEIFSAAFKPIEKALTLAPTTPAASATPAAQEPPTTPAEVVAQSVKELEPLLKDAKKKLKTSEVNDFWDKAVDGHKAPTKPDMLSYEQAKQLGLTPEDEP
jgi:DNA-binding response OmpR family regulator